MKLVFRRTGPCSKCAFPYKEPLCEERYKCIICSKELPPCSFGNYDSGIPAEQCCEACWMPMVPLYSEALSKERYRLGRTGPCPECTWRDALDTDIEPPCKERYKCVKCGGKLPPCMFGDYDSGIYEEQCCAYCWLFLCIFGLPYEEEGARYGEEDD